MEFDSADSLQERIYQWATKIPPWQADLLHRLARGPLTAEDENEVLEIVLEADDAPTPQPVERDDLPADEADTGPVELCEIHNVKNVNLLAERQRLKFEPGLNVVFGATGAGKSGYGRLLRWLCHPKADTKLLPNLFDDPVSEAEQIVEIDIAVEGETREMEIDLAKKPDHLLSAMSVFDSMRAPIYVSKPNVIEHVPSALLILRRLAEAQEALKAIVKERVSALQDELPLMAFNPATSAGRLAEEFTEDSTKAHIERLTTLTEKEAVEKKRLEAELTAMSQGPSRELEKSAREKARATAKVVDLLDRLTEQLSNDRLEEIADLRKRLDQVTAAERKLAADSFSEQPFSGAGEGLWREMWEAARRFVEAGERSFPAGEPGADCPLCQQSLDAAADERMAKFEEFVHSDLRGQIASLTKDLSSALGEVPDVASKEALVEVSLSGAPEKVIDCAVSMLEALSGRADIARRSADDYLAARDPYPEIPSSGPIRAFVVEQAEVAEAQKAVRDEAKERALRARITELGAKDEVAAAMPELLKRASGLAQIVRYKKVSAALGMTKINALVRRLQQDVVTSRLRSAVLDELEAFDLLVEEVDVDAKAKSGQTAIQFALRGTSATKLSGVLSDGEQRALALAFFLAESSVNGSRSAIILDDPAALLDLERRRHVATRLVEQARRRQVIVLTHDLSFVQMLSKAAADDDQEVFNQVLRRENGRAGVLQEAGDGDDMAMAAEAGNGGERSDY